jgi:hypothetical protein
MVIAPFKEKVGGRYEPEFRDGAVRMRCAGHSLT